MKHTCASLLSIAAILCHGALMAQVPCIATTGLSTPYNSNNGLDGIMFDVTALQTVTINCFEMNFAAGTCDPVIRHKDGTHAGFEALPGAWTAIDSLDGVVGTGPDLPTYIAIDVNVTIPAGATHAFYISNRGSAAPNAKYTDGTTFGAVFASDANLQVREGTGINYPFAFNLNPRKFNGGIYYTSGTTGVEQRANTLAFSISPNPVTDILAVIGDRGGSIVINDAMGRTVLHGPWTSRVSVSELATGTYLFTVLDQRGVAVATRRFVKE